MKNRTEKQKNNSMNEQTEKKTEVENVEEQVEEQNDTTVNDIELYPLRKPSDDPRWALWVVRIWVGIALFLLIFIITLFVLGFWFD